MFTHIESMDLELSPNAYRIFSLRKLYINSIDSVIHFLQNKNSTLAHSICSRTYLPEASRFAQLEELDWAFGSMGIQDKARHLATLYLEDIGDLIKEAVDPHFGFSRYAERLGRTATHFAPIKEELLKSDSFISNILKHQLANHIKKFNPTVICLSVPFPGNLFGAFKCAQYIKTNHPAIKVVLGGGYANTELRRLNDAAVFDYLDYVCLDDGERPLELLLPHLDGKLPVEKLKRTFSLINGKVVYNNGATEKDISQREVGTPDYADLPLNNYLSVIEIANPMHRLWSDGRWNKLTLAHGCYWGKCSFCDISLDYISNYEPVTATILCDRIEQIISQTGQTGFHFVDEAAPPALLKDLALEILRRGLTITWWTNIRFEKTFTYDLARLLKASGCIAVAGGLEVASDRLLKLMEKGVTVAQVARVADGFTRAGIMVHAYLMYGFPTQTDQETVDALEMVRQLFENDVLQSGFWHRFAMTAHSPVGLNPKKYGVVRTGPTFGGFADNDLFHDDPTGANHELFSEGLSKSLFNYMHGVGLNYELKRWFSFKTPKTTVAKNYIEKSLNDSSSHAIKPSSTVVWLGSIPELHIVESQQAEVAQLEFYDQKEEWQIQLPTPFAKWLVEALIAAQVSSAALSFEKLKASYESANLGDFNQLLKTKLWQTLCSKGLLTL